MIQLLGQFSLVVALIFAFLQSFLPLWGFYQDNIYLKAFARPSALGQFAFVMLAYALLTFAFYNNDFSLTYVAANSHASLPLMYRLTAVWGAHEGSILLWILILNLWTMIFCVTQKVDTLYMLITAILGVISFAFLVFLIFTSNPFLTNHFAKLGHDLNPLLQDPGFIIHPPMLYMGYVGFSVAFAITQAALFEGELSYTWAHLSRRFAMAAWCFLTFGIMLGSWWAYRVLGWGGFWFWDPVENASLLPWLTGTALLHILILTEKRKILNNWAALLSIISFVLSLLGTFLVRSGVLISAHSFANDPARGIFLLLILATVTIIALTIYIIRIKPFNQALSFTWLSREMALILNSSFLLMAMLIILLGTLYPLIIDGLNLGKISVGAPYYNKVMLPFVLIMMLFMGLGPFCQWQTNSIKNIWHHTWKKVTISILSAVFLLYVIHHRIDFIATISLSVSLWVILSISNSIRTLPAMSLAHLGFATLIIGIMLSSLLNQEREIRIKPGNATSIGPYQFLFIQTQLRNGENYRGIQASFDVMKDERHITTMYPEKRLYPVRDTVMTKIDIQPGIFRDLYIALGEPLDNDYWSVRLYYKPFIRFIWFGGMMMILGGILALIQRKYNEQFA